VRYLKGRELATIGDRKRLGCETKSDVSSLREVLRPTVQLAACRGWKHVHEFGALSRETGV